MSHSAILWRVSSFMVQETLSPTCFLVRRRRLSMPSSPLAPLPRTGGLTAGSPKCLNQHHTFKGPSFVQSIQLSSLCPFKKPSLPVPMVVTQASAIGKSPSPRRRSLSTPKAEREGRTDGRRKQRGRQRANERTNESERS